jgi:hypothetical protein
MSNLYGWKPDGPVAECDSCGEERVLERDSYWCLPCLQEFMPGFEDGLWMTNNPQRN